MKVILLEDVRNVGKKDEVKEVSDGYAQNFLIKNKKAVLYNKASSKDLNSRKAEEAAHQAELKAQAEKTQKELEDLVLEFQLNTGKGGNTFGQISTKQIAQALAEQGIQVEKRKIILDTPVDSLGTTKVKVDLYKGQVIGTIRVHVSAKGA